VERRRTLGPTSVRQSVKKTWHAALYGMQGIMPIGEAARIHCQNDAVGRWRSSGSLLLISEQASQSSNGVGFFFPGS
jgi:hypothetical protein